MPSVFVVANPYWCHWMCQSVCVSRLFMHCNHNHNFHWIFISYFLSYAIPWWWIAIHNVWLMPGIFQYFLFSLFNSIILTSDERRWCVCAYVVYTIYVHFATHDYCYYFICLRNGLGRRCTLSLCVGARNFCFGHLAIIWVVATRLIPMCFVHLYLI